MHLKKFHAATMADALAQVKVQLGADAVILANRKIKDADGQTVVEVTAAVDTPPAAPSGEHSQFSKN